MELYYLSRGVDVSGKFPWDLLRGSLKKNIIVYSGFSILIMKVVLYISVFFIPNVYVSAEIEFFLNKSLLIFSDHFISEFQKKKSQ